MTTNIFVRRTSVTEDQKSMLAKKADRLGKFFDDEASAEVVVGEQHAKKIVEVTIRANGMIYRAEERNEEVYAAMDKIVDSIERQIRKNKTRLEKKLRCNLPKDAFLLPEEEEDTDEIKIVKTKTHHIKPMSAQEAVLQMNLLGHNFFVFKNAQTDSTDIVYRRKDGNFGLIETQ